MRSGWIWVIPSRKTAIIGSITAFFGYLPHFVAAATIMLIGMMVAQFSGSAVTAAPVIPAWSLLPSLAAFFISPRSQYRVLNAFASPFNGADRAGQCP